MDPFVARLSWAVLFGMVLGALVVLVGAGVRRRRHDREIRKNYLSSFRYVLSSDPDMAIEMLTKVPVEAPGGAETWLALGTLLRRRGEHGKAIRIHEKLIADPRLHRSVRLAAAHELGRDFRSAGMWNRAAETLERLLEADPGQRVALRELRQIYEEGGDWTRALETQTRLDLLGEADPSLTAHLEAARARSLLATGKVDEAFEAAKRALALDPEGADPHLALGEIHWERGDWSEAIDTWAKALDRVPALLDRIQPLMEAAFEARGERSGFGLFLAERMARDPGNPWLHLAVARHLRHRGLTHEAAATLRGLLALHPRMVEARRELGELLVEKGSSEELRKQLQAALEDLHLPHRPFGCSRCGVDLLHFSFRCPRCFGWDTVERQEACGGDGEEKAADRTTGS